MCLFRFNNHPLKMFICWINAFLFFAFKLNNKIATVACSSGQIPLTFTLFSSMLRIFPLSLQLFFSHHIEYSPTSYNFHINGKLLAKELKFQPSRVSSLNSMRAHEEEIKIAYVQVLQEIAKIQVTNFDAFEQEEIDIKPLVQRYVIKHTQISVILPLWHQQERILPSQRNHQKKEPKKNV